MTQPDHLADDVFSDLVDGQLSSDDVSIAQAHVATCHACRARLAEMQDIGGLRIVSEVDLTTQNEIVSRIVDAFPVSKSGTTTKPEIGSPSVFGLGSFATTFFK